MDYLEIKFILESIQLYDEHKRLMGLNDRIDSCTNIKIRGQRGPGMPTKTSGKPVDLCCYC